MTPARTARTTRTDGMTRGARRTRGLVAGGAVLALAATLTGCSGSSGGSGSGDTARRSTTTPGEHQPAYPNPPAPSWTGGPSSEPTDRYGAPTTPGPEPTGRSGEWVGDGMTDPSRDPLSTFALDVDTGSYTRWRDAVRRGDTPPADEVRVEEFVNYFEQDYARPRDGIGVSIDGARLPFDTGRRIVRVGIQSAAVDESQRPDADLVLVVDCSGSMGDEGKMELAKSSLRMLAGSLRPSDRVAMVCYSTTARVSLEPTRVSEGDAIDHAIDELEPDASTNAEAGLEAGYRLADRMHTSGRMTRVVLISDGVANVGSTTAGGILETIGEHARQGTHLVSVGVGMGTYNDRLLEQLADRGDGWHAYVDTEDEARRVFSEDLAGTLVITGRQAKAQVDFDPEQVAAYRLIGYENRDVADRDFRNDAVDGGEVRAGHSTTALYEVVLRDGSSTTPFARATIRYVDASGATVERDATASARDVGGAIADASPRLVQDLSVAMLADELTGGAWSRRISFSDVGEASSAAARRLPADRDVSELSDLVERLD